MAEKVIAIKVDLQGTEAQRKKIARLETEVKKLTNRRTQLNKAQKNGTISLKKYGQEIAKVNTGLKSHRRQLLVTRQEMLGIDGFTTRLGKSFRKMGSSIVAGFAGLFAVQQVFQVFKDAIKTLEEFEQQMAKVKAVTGATETEFNLLTTSAKELGRASLFTSTEVGKLQEELAKLGFSTPEILAASDAILQLATASGSDLAQSAVVSASTLRGFGLDATETQRIVDVMAKSFSSTSLDINKFQTAMATVAPVAKTAGISVEKTTALLGTLTDAGFDASTAGTALRNIFLEIGKRGITLEQGLSQIRNSSDKTTTALDLFGKRGAALAITLADNEQKSIDLTHAFNDASGAASEMADIIGNTSVGATKKLSSAYEGMILTIGEGSEDGLTKVKLLAAELLNAFTDVNNQINRLRAVGENSIGLSFGSISESQEDLLRLLDANDEFLKNNVSNAEAVKQKRIDTAENILKLKEQIKQAQKDDNDDLAENLTVIANIQAKFFKDLTAQQDALKNAAEASKASSLQAEIEAKALDKKADAVNNVKFALEELEEVEDDTFDFEEEQIQKSTNAILAFSDLINEESEKRLEIAENEAERKLDIDSAAMQNELEQRANFEQELQRQKIDLAEQAANALVDVSNRRVEREKTLELAALDSRLQQGLISQEQFEKQREAIERKAFQKQKRLELAQIAISLAREIANIAANSAGNPLNAFTFGSAGAAQNIALAGIATARSAVQAGIVASQRFAEGGYTGSGFGSPDSSGFKQAGIVHEGEYVVPKNVLDSQRGASLVGALEAMRTNRPQPFSNIGFANGGFTSAGGVDISGLRNEITQAVASSIGAIQVVNNATDTITQAAKVNNIQSEATFG
jgi:hypothetical protein